MDRYYNIVNYVHGYSTEFLYCLASCASLVKMRTSINVCGMSVVLHGVMSYVAKVRHGLYSVVKLERKKIEDIGW